MDQAALQVLHYIKSDLDLFLIDYKYIKDVISKKLSTPVSPHEFNVTLSELSSVNSPLRRPTIACICRASAINIDSQNLRVNVDEHFSERFFDILESLNLSQHDKEALQKARLACGQSVVKVSEDKNDDMDYYEKYDDDQFDDDDSQSKRTFENKNIQMQSYVEDSMFSDGTPHIDGATASRVLTASEYEGTMENTDFMNKITSIGKNVQSHSYYDDDEFEQTEEEKNLNKQFQKRVDDSKSTVPQDISVKQSSKSDSYYDNDFEDVLDASKSLTHHNSERSTTQQDTSVKQSSISDSYYDNDFEDVVEDNSKNLPVLRSKVKQDTSVNTSDTSSEKHNGVSENGVDNKSEYGSRKEKIADINLQGKVGNEKIISVSCYDDDFEDMALANDEVLPNIEVQQSVTVKTTNVPETVDSYENDFEESNSEMPSQESKAVTLDEENIDENRIGVQESIQSHTSYGDDFEGSDHNLGILSKDGTRESHISNDVHNLASSTLSNVNYENDFEESSAALSPGKAIVQGSKYDLTGNDNQHIVTEGSKKSSTIDGVEDIQGNARKSDDEFDFPNLDTIEDSTASSNSVLGPLAASNSQHESDEQMTKYGSSARRDSMLTFLRNFSGGVTIESDDEKEKICHDDGSSGDDVERSLQSSGTHDTSKTSHVTPKAKPTTRDDVKDFLEEKANCWDDSSEMLKKEEMAKISGVDESDDVAPSYEKSTPIPYEYSKHEVNCSPRNKSPRRPQSAHPTQSTPMTDMAKSRPFSAQHSPTKKSEEIKSVTYDSTLSNDSNSISKEFPTTDAVVTSDEDCVEVKKMENQRGMLERSTSHASMEKYASNPRATALFINRDKNSPLGMFRPKSAQMLIIRQFSSPLAERPASANATLKRISSKPLLNSSKQSPPRQALISNVSRLLVGTESLAQERRPVSANNNAFCRTSGSVPRSLSADRHKYKSKLAEKYEAMQKAAEIYEKKAPIPTDAFVGCVKPKNKGHVFAEQVVSRKPHVPLEAFADTVKPKNPGHNFDPPTKPPPRARVPYEEFQSVPEKKLHVIDDSKPVRDLKAFYKLIKNKITIIENTVKCVHDLCKEEVYNAMKDVQAERVKLNEREVFLVTCGVLTKCV